MDTGRQEPAGIEPLTAIALVCTLRASPSPSSSELLGRQVLDALAQHGVTGDVIEVPEKVETTTKTVAAHAARVARLLKASPYPPV